MWDFGKHHQYTSICAKTSNFSCKLPCFRIFIKFSKQQLGKMCIKDIKVGCVEISPSSSVKNLGVWFDSSLNMSEHITKLCASAFFYIYNIRHIRKYLSRESAETWVNAFIFSRFDYGNSPLFDLPHYQIQKLRRVQNASARLIFSMPRYCRITPLLFDLHWLDFIVGLWSISSISSKWFRWSYLSYALFVL